MQFRFLDASIFQTVRTLLFPIALLVAVVALAGCATTHRGAEVAFEPLGPGAVFDSVEAAVVDAMAFSVIEARRTGATDRMHGGAITSVPDGYTYAEPVVAAALTPQDIRYVIGRHDVARYHVYPKADDIRERRSREHVTRWDKTSVDENDPHHRPLYFLTPTLVVKAYRGDAVAEQEVARLDEDGGAINVVKIAASMP